MSNMIENDAAFLWVEKYRPSDIKDIIIPDRLVTECMSYVKDGQIPSMLLSGSAGIGKTTIAKALANMIGADLLYINSSNESGVDTIRTKIIQFASTASMEGNLKIALLDECLHEDEKVRIGTVDEWEPTKLKDLEIGKTYPVVSMNMETGAVENDVGRIISMKDDEVFMVTLEDGRQIRANSKHPFLVEEDGKFEQRELCNLKEGDFVIALAGALFDYMALEKMILKIESIGTHRVLNLTVEKNHTFITENGIPTHNCDMLSQASQGALRGVFEEFHQNTRFILTCNFKNKIMDAIHSRCISIDFSTTREEKEQLTMKALKRCFQILDSESVEYDKKAVAVIVKRFFPDMRRVLNALQKAAAGGKIDATSLSESIPTDALYDLMKNKKFGEVRKWVADNYDDYQSVYRDIYDRLLTLFDGQTIPDIVVILDDAQDRVTRVADPEISFMRCLTEIMAIANWK